MMEVAVVEITNEIDAKHVLTSIGID